MTLAQSTTEYVASERRINRATLMRRALIASAVLIVFWRVLQFPFVQDDWAFVHDLSRRGAWAVIIDAFLPSGKLFYRPVGITYFAGMYEVFGLHVVWYHCAALAIHCLNCFLVARIAEDLTGRVWVGFATAIVYGSAVTVHLMPLTWVVGIYDLAATLFGLLSVVLLSRALPISSALLLLLALGSKEAAVCFVPILVGYQALRRDGSISARFRALGPHAIVVAIYGVVKWLGSSIATIPSAHPYVETYRASVVWEGVELYARWLGHAFAPIDGEIWYVAALAAIVGVTAAWLAFQDTTPIKIDRRFWVLMVIWAVAGMMPVLGLANHRYAYYLTYSWIALALVAIDLVAAAAFILTKSACGVRLLLAGCVLAAVTSNIRAYRSVERSEGVADMVGSVRLASQAPLLVPMLPHRATLIFDRIATARFGESLAPQVWYGDDTISVTRADRVRCAGGRLAVMDSVTGILTPLGPNTFWFQPEGNRLVRNETAMVDRAHNCGQTDPPLSIRPQR